MLGQQKVGKVAGSQRQVSEAHGEAGTEVGTSRGPAPLTRLALQCRPPALQGSGLAAQPRRRCSSRRAGWPATVSLSFPPLKSTAPGRRGRGGAGLAAWPQPRGSQLRPPPSFGRCRGPLVEGAALTHGRQLAAGSGSSTGRLMAGQRERERRPRPDPNAQSPLELRALSRREQERAPHLPPARPPWPGASGPLEKQTTGGSGHRLSKVVAQATLQICQDFLRESRGPNLFQNKVRSRKQPLPVYHQPAA